MGGDAARTDLADIATVRALWCALHPEEPVTPVVEELASTCTNRPDAIVEALRRIRAGRLERAAWITGPACSVLEMTLEEVHLRGRA